MSELLENIARFETAVADLKTTISEAHAAEKSLRAATREAVAKEAAIRQDTLAAVEERMQPILDKLTAELGVELRATIKSTGEAFQRRFEREVAALWLDTQGNDVRDDIRDWTRAVSSWTKNQPPPDRLGLPDLRKKET